MTDHSCGFVLRYFINKSFPCCTTSFLNSLLLKRYRAFSRDVIKFLKPKLKSHQTFYLRQSSDVLNVYLLTTFQLNSVFGNQRILHFRVMAVRDIKLKNRKGAKTERTWYPMWKTADSYFTTPPLDCERLSFPRKSPGEDAKLRASLLARHAHGHARTLTRFAFFPADFRGRERLLAVYRDSFQSFLHKTKSLFLKL